MKQQKVAFITGVTGQDGSYLADLLLTNGYEVHGLIRPSSRELPVWTRLAVKQGLKLHYGDMLYERELSNILDDIRPNEIYNLAAQSHVGVSFEMASYTQDVNYVGLFNLIEAIDNSKLNRVVRLYQASSSEMFGINNGELLDEKSPFNPVSPYAKSKLQAHEHIAYMRKARNLFACSGILFNHESVRRRSEFVTRKVTKGLVAIHYGSAEPLVLGNLDAERDWGASEDYVRAMWLMLQNHTPKDYVIATGVRRSVKDLVNEVAKNLNMHITWEGTGVNTVGIFNGRVVVKCSTEFHRPIDVQKLTGCADKATLELCWTPTVDFSKMIRNMVLYDKKQFTLFGGCS
jgi:GDPmannose 4,6-dehydratase